jgi:PAS domain S-box-containing protein
MTVNTATDPYLTGAIERQRVEALYSRLPGSIASMLLGVAVTFALLMPTGDEDLLKIWAAYMLTTLALRGWIWHQFRTMDIDIAQLRGWEWGHALGMLLTGLGWATVCGALFPTEAHLQNYIWLMIIVVAYTGVVLAATSRLSFVLFVTPTLLPALWRFVELNHATMAALIGAAGCLAVVGVMHQSMHSLLMKHLRKQVEAEQLLVEQNAIFQSATVGIGVFEGSRLIKCNPRFGELFGRTLHASTQLPSSELFADQADASRFADWSSAEFEAARTARTMERMRRADGSQFWAELSERRMYYGDVVRDLWMISEAPVQGREK